MLGCRSDIFSCQFKFYNQELTAIKRGCGTFAQSFGLSVQYMRFHKSELAFFVFIALVMAAGGTLAYLDGMVPSEIQAHMRPEMIPLLQEMRMIVYTASGLLMVAVLFGLFFIYPLIREQVRERGHLREMTETLSARSETLEHAALTDGLTGMQNRRYFDDALAEYLSEFRRIDKPIGLIILDLDHFKQVNDTHGHDVGDEVLRQLANCLREFTRYHDVVARLGGEEFAVVAPNLNIDSLQKLAERIRKAVSNLVVVSGNVRLRVTASMGLAVWDRRESAEDFYRRADKMLYQAKREGRNRVCA
jgi:two-component system cell cycle response regulator